MQFRVQVLPCVAKPQPKGRTLNFLFQTASVPPGMPDLDEGWQMIIMPVFQEIA